MRVLATVVLTSQAIYLVAAIPLLLAIVVAILVWRNASTERDARQLWTSLADRSPTVRRGALDALTDDAVAYNAPLLCEVLTTEQDPDVLDALAAAVARSKWEPTTDPALQELRRWVAGGHARTTASSREPSTPQPVSGEDAPASVVADRSEEPTPRSPRTDQDSPGVAARTAREAPTTAGTATAMDDGLSTEELDQLVPKVRAVLGEALERLELVSIEGKVLARWSSDRDAAEGRDGAGGDA
jgi:hypothetical protein